MSDPRKVAFDAARAADEDHKLTDHDMVIIHAALDAVGHPRAPEAQGEATTYPPWITVARALIGQKEIPGPQHNSWIAKGWARLGAKWFNDDETPWCGFLIAHCMDAVGLPYPGKGEFARAKSWATYGYALAKAVPGSIGVKSRTGGGHVYFIIGETADKTAFVVIEGNANNMVRIGKVLKSATEAIRWPAGIPIPVTVLPVLTPGTAARSEA